jgi:predicted PurR-regulated permease PerM
MDMRSRRRALVIALGVAGGISGAELVGAVWRGVSGVVSLVAAALFVAIAMEPMVGRLERRMRRGVAAGLVLAGGVLTFALMAAIGGAVALSQGRNLLDNLPAIASSIDVQLSQLGIETQLAERAEPGGAFDTWVGQLDDVAVGVGGRMISTVGRALAVLFMAFYLSADLHRIIRGVCSRVAPRRQTHVLRAWSLAVEKAGGYLYSRLVLGVVAAVVHSIAFIAVGIDYPIPLGLWVAVVSQLIPVVGTYLGGAAPVAVALSQGPRTALIVLVVLIVYQQVENLFLSPKITANAIRVHPLTAFISVLAGGAAMGWGGALVAVPLAATATAFVDAFLPRHEVAHQIFTPGGRRSRRGSAGPGGGDDGDDGDDAEAADDGVSDDGVLDDGVSDDGVTDDGVTDGGRAGRGGRERRRGRRNRGDSDGGREGGAGDDDRRYDDTAL